MKISVIVPYFKGDSYLEECVQSIENQKLSELEILVVDDRDGDDVPETVLRRKYVRHIVMEKERDAEEYFANRRRFFSEKGLEEEMADRGASLKLPLSGELDFQRQPFGVAAARNTGVRHATGEYIYFLDADDYLWEDALAKLVRLADEKNAKVVTGNRYGSWFGPRGFSPGKAKADSEIQGVVPVCGGVTEELLHRRFTVQHLLIRRDYYDSLGQSFDEYNTFYSDVPVVAGVFAGAPGEFWADGSSIYVWRHHNDPVHLAALCQQKRARRLREYIESYESAREILDAGDRTPEKDHIDYALKDWMCRFAAARFPDSLGGRMLVRYMNQMKQITSAEWKRMKNQFGVVKRTGLAELVKGRCRTAVLIGKLGGAAKKAVGIVRDPLWLWTFLDKMVFRRLPVRENWVFVESFFGKSYSDSPKYLYEYLYDTYGDKYRYIWCLNRRTEEVKGHPVVCRRDSLRYVYYTARAKYMICNIRQPVWYKKREGTVFVQTWHGTPLKKLAFDLDDIYSASQNHKSKFYAQSQMWDYLISANRFSTDIFERAFCYPREKIIETGYPRNDILYSEQAEETAREVRSEIGIPDGKRVILYAPTFRDDQFYGQGKYKFSLALDLQRMRKEFGNDSVLLLRVHYHIANAVDLTGVGDFVYNVSEYSDISKIYLISDLCITDYSSVMFDFANLRRPMLFFAYDYETYRDELRGMYLDIEEELPGPLVRTNDELVSALHDMEQVSSRYRERYEKFYGKFCYVDDGNAAERVITTVFGKEKA